jgi:hypothetical protein
MKLKIAFVALIASIFVIAFAGCESNTPPTPPTKVADFTIEITKMNDRLDTIEFRGYETTTFHIDSSGITTWLSAVNKSTVSKTTLDVGVKGFRIINKKVQ